MNLSTDVTIAHGATILGSCTMPFSDPVCGGSIVALAPGSYDVTYTVDNGVDTAVFTGTIVSVSNVAPAVTIQWQDVDGTWINANSLSLTLLGSVTTEARCLVTNNSNAPATLSGFQTVINHPAPAPPTVVTHSGTLAPGETRALEMYSGPVADVLSHACSGGITCPAGTGGNGGGNGGGVVPIAGTISASGLNIDPGDTVTITGVGLLPSISDVFAITVDGAAAVGSPTLLVMPAGDLSFNVEFPTSGTYTLAIHNVVEGQNVTFASFTISVAGLAATGVDASAGLLVATLLLLSGTVFVVARIRTA